jgi:cystathionine beta-lyase/cystathionine gamma-synthase
MKSIQTHPSIETRCAHAGTGSGDGVPLATPLVQSTTFCRDGVGSVAEHQYSRVSNPTVSALEGALGHLEDAGPAVCFSTGLAAETALFLALLRSGDHLVCAQSVYGGTTRLVEQVLAPLGIHFTLVDATHAARVRDAIRPDTRLVFVETPANPTLELTDLRAVARIARAAAVPLAVDNTFLTPVLQQPLDLGADLSIYSTTKFVEGHSAAPGGAIVSRDPQLLDRIRWIRKSTGAIQTPLHAWLTLQGLKTLPLRIRAQSATAQIIAERLEGHPELSRVGYPTLLDRTLAESQHLGAHGAVISIEFEQGLEAAARFVESLRLCRLVEHVGSVETLVTHPATMTHADVDPAERRRVGVSDGLVRISVGLESTTELLEDIEQALAASSAVAGGVR